MSAGLPSFDRAEFLPQTTDTVDDAHGVADRCAQCGRQVGRYFRLDSQPMCEPCVTQAMQSSGVGAHGAFARAIAIGVGAALLGLILYAGVEIATGWVIGYAAIAVGYLVGKGMKMGSRGRGGRRYQIAAAVLTYFAVALAAIPVGVHSYAKQQAGEHRAGASTVERDTDDSGLNSGGTQQTRARIDLGPGVVLPLLGRGLVSPFLELGDGVSGLIGLFILFLGVRTAWQLTSGSEMLVTGPHRAA